MVFAGEKDHIFINLQTIFFVIYIIMNKLARKDIEDIFALTAMQEGMLFHYLKEPESDVYFEQLSLSLVGDINTEIFEQAWNFVVQTNEMLRTMFRWTGRWNW